MATGMPAKIETFDQDGVHIMSVQGEVDLSNCKLLEECLISHGGQDQSWLFDFSDTSYLDSEGIKVLLRCIKSIKTKGGRVAILHNKVTGRVFRVIQMTSLVECCPDYDTALYCLRE